MKFLADGMIGRLARWMRLIGCDVEYLNDVPDDELLKRAASENRILLTSDVALYRNAVTKGADAFLVSGKDQAEKLAKVAKRFDLSLKVNTNTSRCPTCGSSIKKVAKTAIKGKVLLTTFKVYNEFWMCKNQSCGKVYWQGSHWKKIDEVLTRANELLSKQEHIRKEGEES